MAFTEIEIAEHMKVLEDSFWIHCRPPLGLRDKIREGQRFKNQAIELFFIRPAYQRPDEEIEDPIAKIRYVRTRKVWHIYRQRADLKWHRYAPHPEAPTLTAALQVINEDHHACFFG